MPEPHPILSPDPKRAKPDVSVLIVAYQSADIISDCLSSIPGACVRYSHEVLLVDNGDGTTEALVSAAFPNVRIVPSQGNVGFAAGNNLLAARAEGRFLLLLNPDVILGPQAIDVLLDTSLTHPAASAWGGVTVDRDGRPDLGNSVHVPSLREMTSRVLGRSSAARNSAESIEQDKQVEALSGSFAMLSRAAWDEVGGLDERYFLYCEEVDLFYRLAKRGHHFRRIASSRAIHDIGHGQPLSPTRMLYRAAGNMQFARLHWSPSGQTLAFLLTWLSACQRLLLGRMIGRWFPRLKVVGESHRDIAMRPDLWRHGYDSKRGLLARLQRK